MKKIILLIILMATVLSIAGWMHYQNTQPKTMPLVPMMQQLLGDMQKIDAGIYTENFDLIAEGAGNIADHPVMTEEDKQLVKTTLAEEIKQFVAFDRTVHHHADSMRAAARQKSMQAVLRHYAIVQQGCVDCHTSYRERISMARK